MKDNYFDLIFGKGLGNKENYNLMAAAIKNNERAYQYFEGMAFYTSYSKTLQDIRPYIKKEISGVKNELDVLLKNQRGTFITLNQKLDAKIKEYEEEERKLFYNLVNTLNLKTNQNLTFTSPPVGGTAAEKIKCWEDFFNYQFLDVINENGVITSFEQDGDSALYCFLMSTELYDYIKTIPSVSSVFSRRGWEKMLTGDTVKYDEQDDKKQKANLKKLENAMWDALDNGDMWNIISNGIDQALADNGISDAIRKGIIGSAKISFDERRETILSQHKGYIPLHDGLKKWGEQALIDINNMFPQKILDKVEIGDKTITFFTITQKGDNTQLQRQLINGIEDGIRNFINLCKSSTLNQNGLNFYNLTVHPYKKKKFSVKTASAALTRFSTFSRRKTIQNFFKTANKSLDSNSVISGILGEMAVILKFASFGIEGESTGFQQQYYKNGLSVRANANQKINVNGQKMTYKEAGFKSSGQFYSDVVFEKFDNLGINVKRYITNKNVFKLTTFQKEGLNLNDVHLRRYLSEDEINLLKFVYVNYSLLKDYMNSYPYFNDIKKVARALMDNNISSILRITGQGFKEINYIIAANGHFIPASCVFQFAKYELDNKSSKLFDITNTKFKYSTVSPDGGEFQPFGTAEEPLNPNNLMIENVLKGKEILTYQFNEFTIRINQLLKL